MEVSPHGQGARPPVRSQAEIRHHLRMLSLLLDQMIEQGARDVSRFSYAEAYTVGMRAAARWTQGDQPTTPVSNRPVAPGPTAIETELTVAEYVAERREAGHDMAAGVVAWLHWLTGTADHLVFLKL